MILLEELSQTVLAHQATFVQKVLLLLKAMKHFVRLDFIVLETLMHPCLVKMDHMLVDL